MSEFAPREHESDHTPVPSRQYHAPSPAYHTYADHAPPVVTHADPAPVILPEPARPPLKLHPAAPAPAPAPIPSVYAPQAPLIIPHAYTQLRTLLARDPGVPLDPQTLARMEANLRVPLGDIRIHDDPGAWTLCAHLATPAHTAGTHLFFAKGAYQPGTVAGRNLLGHQLERAVAWRAEQQAKEAAQPAAAPAQPAAAHTHEAPHQPPVAASVPAAMTPAATTHAATTHAATTHAATTHAATDWPRPDRTGFVALPTPLPGRLAYPAGAEPYADASDFVLRVRPRRDAPPILPLGLYEGTRVLVLGTTAGATPDRWYDVRVEQPALSGLEGWIGHGEVALDAGASAAAPTAASAPHKHGGGGAHPSGGAHAPTGEEADAIDDVRSHLHWPHPAVQALVTLNDRPAALLADAPPDHAHRFALHLNGQVLPLAQAPAGAVYWAMQDILAAGPTGDNPGAAGSLLAALARAVGRSLEGIATLPGQFVDALTAEGKTLLRTLLGPQVIAELDRAGDVVGAILANPVGFFAHLATALKDGFDGFLAHLGAHLTDGLTAWLGRELGGLAIEAPAHFDLPGVVSVVLQGLGVTYSHLRSLLVKHLGPGGEATVEAMERGYRFLQELAAPGGLVAAWHQVLGLTGVHIQDLVGLVVGGATSWLEGRLAVSVTEHLLTLCSGAGSIVAAVQSIYNAVTFFLNNRDAIAALADRVLGMVSTIATGKAADLAHLGGEVEATMASTLPLLIDFLARQVGLGDIGGEISRLIGQVQQPIATLENKLVGVIARKAHVYGHAAPGAAHQGGRVRPGDFPRKEVETDEGRHTIYVELQGDRAVVMMASTPAPLIAFFDAAARDDTIPAQDKEHIPEGMRLVAHLNALVQQIVAGALAGKAETETQPLKTAMMAASDGLRSCLPRGRGRVAGEHDRERGRFEAARHGVLWG